MADKDLNSIYITYAETFGSIGSSEKDLYNKYKLLQELKEELSAQDSDGGYGTDMSAHAFKQIAERFEELALQNQCIFEDVFKPDSPQDSLLLSSNLKSFIITLLSNARKKGEYKEETAQNGGFEFRFTVNIKKWSKEKTLQFVGIVQNNVIKTGFFNWV